MKYKILLQIFFLSLIVYSAKAQNPNSGEIKDSLKQETISNLPAIATDRPDQTESPFIVPKGRIQIETGYMMENDKTQDLKLKNRTYNTTLLKLGLSQFLELRLIVEYLGTNIYKRSTNEKVVSEKGMNSITIGSKFFICEEKGIIPKISLITHLQLPYFGNKFYRPSYIAPRFRFLMQNTITDKISLSYNVGGEWNGNTTNTTGIYTLALGIALAKGLNMFVESYGFLAENSGKDDKFNGTFSNDHRLDGGFTYLLQNNLQLDISGGIGLSKSSPDNFMSCGVSWRIKN
jgi:hypothetical protein